MRYGICLPAMVLVSGIAMGQVTPDPALRKSRNTYSPVMEILKSRRTPATDEQLEQLKTFPFEAIWTVFAMGFDPHPALQVGVEWNIPIRVGDATVLPGDVVVVEEEAALFFPPELADKVVKGARKIVEKENYERALVRQKKYRFRDVYPLNPALLKQFEEEQAKKCAITHEDHF